MPGASRPKRRASASLHLPRRCGCTRPVESRSKKTYGDDLMDLLRFMLAALIPLALLGPAFGQMHLEWKLKEGDQFFLQTANALKHTIKSTSSTIGEETTTVER